MAKEGEHILVSQWLGWNYVLPSLVIKMAVRVFGVFFYVLSSILGLILKFFAPIEDIKMEHQFKYLLILTQIKLK